MTTRDASRPGGLPYALAAYLIWGLFPLYLRLLAHVPALEFVGWRVLATLPVCLLLLLVTRRMDALLAALRSPRTLALMLVSALLIGGNWMIYTLAVQQQHVFAASLGYYINPLVNVLAGTLFLGEKLSRRQWAAVALAAAGVSLLAWDALPTLAISLSLAGTFAAYGLVRKLAPVDSLPGLTIETLLLILPAIGILAWHDASPAGLSVGHDGATDLLLAGSGAITASALLAFAVAARRMDYSALGFVQFLSPTIVFVLALTVFKEPLRPAQMACFVMIWSAIAIFVWDLLMNRRQPAAS